MLTVFRGRVRFSVPILYSAMFLMLFVIGGLTGITLATPPVDYQVHNTVYLVAHFHNMLIPGTLFGMLAGYSYWFPKAFGFRLNEAWGRFTALCFGGGFLLAFMPLYVLGISGMPRRSQAIFTAEFAPLLWTAEIGAVLLSLALVGLYVQLWVSIRDRHRNAVPLGDPWDGRTLEWTTIAPPPEYNFAVLPTIHDRDPFTWLKEHGLAHAPVLRFEDIHLPKNSATPLVIGAASFVCAFGLVWHIGWAAAGGFLLVWGTVIARSFVGDTERVITGGELREAEENRQHLLEHTHSVTRDHEHETLNTGLAQVRT
jgi:cytochrome o ubiquinol oxidase subunit 1